MISEFGSRLATSRMSANLTQAQAGEAVGIARVSWAKLEGGVHLPTTMRLKAICVLLGVSSDYLLGIARDRCAHTAVAVDMPLPYDVRCVLRTGHLCNHRDSDGFDMGAA